MSDTDKQAEEARVEQRDRYAEGNREEATCRSCGSPIWIVYHGPNRNHTTEPRLTLAYIEELEAALRRLISAMDASAYNRQDGCSCRGMSLSEEDALRVAKSLLATTEASDEA